MTMVDNFQFEMKKLRKCRFLASMKIITFEEKYRDDLIFMILEAKDALIQLNSGVLALKSGYYSSEQGVCADGMISMEECFV